MLIGTVRNGNTAVSRVGENGDGFICSLAVFKNFPIHENLSFDFRVEAFNLFNRVQFGSPNTQFGNAQFGWITAQFNNPRLLQVSGWISF